MEKGILQIFWVIIIIAILAFNIIKRVSANKKKDRTVNDGRTREDNSYRKDNDRKPVKKIDWENIIGNILGVEFDKPQLRKVSSPREEFDEADYVDGETVKDVIPEDESIEAGISEFHTSIEDRHLETTLKPETEFHTSIEDRHLETTLKPETELDSSNLVHTAKIKHHKDIKCKKSRIIKNKILNKHDLQTAIIFSEIIGPPVSRRKATHHGRRQS